ncbi:hypothetical protein PFISCL1PPCAC_5469, partial [Pristionchus fissidentatus]
RFSAMVKVEGETCADGASQPTSSYSKDVKKQQNMKGDDKIVEDLCGALQKVEVKDSEKPQKSFKVVDDVEKKAYKQEKKGVELKLGFTTKSPPHMKEQSSHKFSVPREWANYSKCGEVVPTTPFLPFKTPFAEERFVTRPELKEHTIMSLIQDLSSKGIRLTTVIDLTLPFFYETELLEAFGIRYEKIRIDNQEPRWHHVKKFLEICDDFAAQQFKRKKEWDERQKERAEKGEPEEYYMYEVIGVHCTRGVNRTGYMICRAMIERMNYTAENAVRLFNQARGHPMTEWMPELKAAEEKRNFFARRGGGGNRGRGGENRGGGARGGGEYRGGGTRGGGEYKGGEARGGGGYSGGEARGGARGGGEYRGGSRGGGEYTGGGSKGESEYRGGGARGGGGEYRGRGSPRGRGGY